MANVIPFNPPKAPEKCSFCGRPKAKVKRLIGEAGGAMICDACVVRCNELLKDK